MKRHFNLL